MEMYHAPCDSPKDGHVVPDELEELEYEYLVAGEGTSMGTIKGQYWVVLQIIIFTKPIVFIYWFLFFVNEIIFNHLIHFNSPSLSM